MFEPLRFFWGHIKPYRFYYAIMLVAPTVASFFPLCYNYALKLFLDLMSHEAPIAYTKLIFPIVLFLGSQVVMELFWRISQVAEWIAEPQVRRSIFVHSYDHLQNHPYRFFQTHLSGSLTSKVKGLVDGYDKFWASMHHGFLNEVFKTIVNLTVLVFVNAYLGTFMLCWSFLFVVVAVYLSKRF